jgi:hypothetical protein
MDCPPLAGYTEILQGIGAAGKVKWEIGKSENVNAGTISGNGLDALLRAQGGGTVLTAGRAYYIDSDPGTTGSTTSNLFEYSLPVKNSLTDIGSEYGVSFNIDYVPFNKASQAAWAGSHSEYFDFAQAAPRWIIRNGLNDVRQNIQTDFAKVGKPGSGYDYKDYNGNGGIWLKVKETLGFVDNDDDGFPDGAVDNDPSDGFPDGPGTTSPYSYLLYRGKYHGKTGTSTANISFFTWGYADSAEVYYLVTAKDDYSASSMPPYNLFTRLGSYPALSARHEATVTHHLVSTTDPDIWLVFIKDGKVSNRIKIKTGSGNIDIGWGWGS